MGTVCVCVLSVPSLLARISTRRRRQFLLVCYVLDHTQLAGRDWRHGEEKQTSAPDTSEIMTVFIQISSVLGAARPDSSRLDSFAFKCAVHVRGIFRTICVRRLPHCIYWSGGGWSEMSVHTDGFCACGDDS